MDYHPLVKSLYQRCGTSVPIDRFVKVVDPRGLGFASRKEMYKPVRFHIKMGDHQTHGTTQMDVPVHGKPEWLKEMRERVGGLLGIDPRRVEFHTVTGQSLADVPLRRLHKVGTLHVGLVTDDDNVKHVRTKSGTAPSVPIEYSVTKARKLKEWYQANVARRLPEKVAAILQQCGNNVEMDQAIRGHGAVQQTIEQHLIESAQPDWPEFVRRHHVNTDAKANAEAADLLLSQLSTNILSNIRSTVSAYKTDVARHLSHKMSEQVKDMGGRTSHFKPIMTSAVSTPASSQHQNNNLMKRIAADALHNPALESNVIRAMHLESKSLRKEKLQPLKQIENQLAASHHPWYAQIHQVTMPVSGQYPSDYMARHTRKNMSAAAPFVGNVDHTYQSYQLFSGQHLAPLCLRIESGMPVESDADSMLIERCHGKSKSKKGKKSSRFARVKGAMPPLVPIACHACGGAKGKDKKCSKCKKCRGANVKASLVPIEETIADATLYKGYNDYRDGNVWDRHGSGADDYGKDTLDRKWNKRDYRKHMPLLVPAVAAPRQAQLQPSAPVVAPKKKTTKKPAVPAVPATVVSPPQPAKDASPPSASPPETPGTAPSSPRSDQASSPGKGDASDDVELFDDEESSTAAETDAQIAFKNKLDRATNASKKSLYELAVKAGYNAPKSWSQSQLGNIKKQLLKRYKEGKVTDAELDQALLVNSNLSEVQARMASYLVAADALSDDEEDFDVHKLPPVSNIFN